MPLASADGDGLRILGRGKGPHLPDRPRLQAGLPLGAVQVEPLGHQRPVGPAAGFAGAFEPPAGLIEVDNGLEPCLADFIGLVVERDRRLGKVVEKGLERLVEQRQPMLHARVKPPGRDRLIERIVARYGAEGFAVAGAEARNAIRI